MRKSRIIVDEEAVKKINEEAHDWQAVCPICSEKLIGTLAELRKHKHGE